MPVYQVTAWRDVTNSATLEITADNAAAAIEAARQPFHDGDGDFEPCGEGSDPIHYMRADNISGCEPEAEWSAPDNIDRGFLYATAVRMLATLKAIERLPTASVDCVRGGVDLQAAIAQAEAAGITTG